MSVTSVEKDFDRLTLTLVADFDATDRAGVAAVGRPAEAGALVGAADLPGDGGRSTTCAPAARSPTS